MQWYYDLEKRLIPDFFTAATSVVPEVGLVELELLNGHVQVFIPRKITRAERKGIESAIEDRGRRLMPDVPEWPVFVPPPRPYTYRSHLDPSPMVLLPFKNPDSIVVFDISVDHILSLRNAERLITDQSPQFTYTVAFALGGVSILERVSGNAFEVVRPLDPRQTPAAMDNFSNRFHLFPGLLWSHTDCEPKILSDWLASIPRGSSVFIFDTGRSGNGPRRAEKVLREKIREGVPVAPSRIHVLGIVDRPDEYQRPVDEVLTTKQGNSIHYTLGYSYVDRMLSEDCRTLLGHDSLREKGTLTPVRDSGVIRIVDNDGRPIHVIASTSTATVYSRLMHEAERGLEPEVRVPLSVEREKAMATRILLDVRSDCYNQLSNACDLRLIDEKMFNNECKRVASLYEKAVATYPKERWDFEEKRIFKY
jgi:hypothetical protein